MTTSSDPATGTFGIAPSTPREELISIVVPCYNASAYVGKCITSLLAQTYRNLEVIAVNDRSTDDTGALLDGIAEQDHRLRVVHAQKNGGPHAARRLGVEAAHGELIGFADSDDHVGAEMFAGLAKALQEEQADIAVCNFVHVDEAGKQRPRVISSNKKVINDDILGRFSRFEFGSGMLWNKLFRKAVIQPHMVHALDRTVDFGEDYIVSIGCFATAKRVVLLPEAFYYYLYHPQSGSNSSNSPKAFSHILNSYVKCLEVYLDAGERILTGIDAIYGHQLRFNGYRITSTAELHPHHGLLRTAIEKLARIRPEAIYVLVHTFDRWGVPPPPQQPRFHLGQARSSLGKAIMAIFKGQA